MEILMRCIQCNYETGEPINKCPKCGHALHKAHLFRAIGWVVASLGGFLMVFSVGIAAVVALTISNAGDAASTTYTGTPDDTKFIFGLLVACFVAGIAALIKGKRIIKHRRM